MLKHKLRYDNDNHTWVTDIQVGCIGVHHTSITKPTKTRIKQLIRFCKYGAFGETIDQFLTKPRRAQ